MPVQSFTVYKAASAMELTHLAEEGRQGATGNVGTRLSGAARTVQCRPLQVLPTPGPSKHGTCTRPAPRCLP